MTRKLINNATAESCESPAAGGGSDCIICVRENPGDLSLRVEQVIECLQYLAPARVVRILLFIAVANDHDTPLKLRILHRGVVSGVLRRMSAHPQEPRESLVRKLYGSRIESVQEEPDMVNFFKRVNCTGIAETPNKFSIRSSGDCFGGEQGEYVLAAEQSPEPSAKITDKTPEPLPVPFTSFVLPDEVKARQRTMFLVELTLAGDAYNKVVGKTFSVDSHRRLKRDIEAFDLPAAEQCYREFYARHVRPETTIEPEAYDIVILQKQGNRVDVEQGSVYITPVCPSDPVLADQVLWFLGQPGEFYLILKYASGENTQHCSGVLLDWSKREFGSASNHTRVAS